MAPSIGHFASAAHFVQLHSTLNAEDYTLDTVYTVRMCTLHHNHGSLPGQRDEVLRCHLDPLDRYPHHLHPLMRMRMMIMVLMMIMMIMILMKINVHCTRIKQTGLNAKFAP